MAVPSAEIIASKKLDTSLLALFDWAGVSEDVKKAWAQAVGIPEGSFTEDVPTFAAAEITEEEHRDIIANLFISVAGGQG